MSQALRPIGQITLTDFGPLRGQNSCPKNSLNMESSEPSVRPKREALWR